MRLVGPSLAIATAAIATALAITPAAATCAEDLTRIQLASEKASPDIQSVVKGLVATAQARVKALDSPGCRAATTEALKVLGLAPLAPVTLSTPVPGLDRNPHPPAPPAAAPSGQASAPKAAPKAPPSADPAHTQQEQKPGDTAARAVPAAPASPATPSADPKPSASTEAGKSDVHTQSGKDWYVITSDLIGKPVTSQDNPGDSVGVIKSVAIDTTTQQAVLVLVETGGFLGIGADVIAMPFSALMFNKRWDRPALQANTEVIRSGPRVTIGDVPKLLGDPAWRKEVSEHFGMPLVVSAAVVKTQDAGTAPHAATPKGKAPAAPAAPQAAAAAAGDPAKGHAYVMQTCAGCHTFDANGGTRVGPNLHNVLGRPVASMSGFTYSQGLKKHGGTWSAASLDQFLQSPQHFASGTVMAFPGIPSAEDRANVIAYLKAIETGQGAKQ